MHAHTHTPQNDISDETLMQFSSRCHLHAQKAHIMCSAPSELFSIFAFDTVISSCACSYEKLWILAPVFMKNGKYCGERNGHKCVPCLYVNIFYLLTVISHFVLHSVLSFLPASFTMVMLCASW